MSGWDLSVIDGPLSIPILGAPEIDPVTGATFRPVVGQRPGYHLNVARRIVTPALAAFEVTPEPDTPLVIWAGDERGPDGRYQLTAFLRFADEAEALAAMGAITTTI